MGGQLKANDSKTSSPRGPSVTPDGAAPARNAAPPEAQAIVKEYLDGVYGKFVGQKQSEESVVPKDEASRELLKSVAEKLGNGKDPEALGRLAALPEGELAKLREEVTSLAKIRSEGQVVRLSEVAAAPGGGPADTTGSQTEKKETPGGTTPAGPVTAVPSLGISVEQTPVKGRSGVSGLKVTSVSGSATDFKPGDVIVTWETSAENRRQWAVGPEPGTNPADTFRDVMTRRAGEAKAFTVKRGDGDAVVNYVPAANPPA